MGEKCYYKEKKENDIEDMRREEKAGSRLSGSRQKNKVKKEGEKMKT